MDVKMLKKCPVSEACGGCQLQGISYDEQLRLKQTKMEKLLGSFCKVNPIIGCDDPYYYRNKVQISFGKDYKGRVICGNYVASTHTIVPVTDCQIASREANRIFVTVRKLLASFRLSVFDEHSMQGFLRHVLVRTTADNEEVMVVLVTGSPVFPKKNDFIKALLKTHPNIVTVVQNVNNRHTSMVLGDKNIVLYGKGFIEDTLCGYVFRLSAQSFYQVNHAQTEKMYEYAIKCLGLTGKETVLDAYCGIGTIGIIMSQNAGHVIGVEINKAAVRDAIRNARMNEVENIEFHCEDAGKFMQKLATEKRHIDVALMDPPRAGADDKFLGSLVRLKPERIVYISCNPLTQKDNLRYLVRNGYEVKIIQPVDLFAFTQHTESIALLERI
ncbi:MAG: 23S rRNA (uracil(1939)-C(5))-methyltransferase RlmD [Erysipelotrichaceae bacterium]|nr:23S rRNA (uracil(1939)-C(5))-methyltransferase RlmD [Erysipelotrichaceae bacterium]